MAPKGKQKYNFKSKFRNFKKHKKYSESQISESPLGLGISNFKFKPENFRNARSIKNFKFPSHNKGLESLGQTGSFQKVITGSSKK